MGSTSLTKQAYSLPEQCPCRRAAATVSGREVNPLGDWTGGTDVDSGATNRKLGSDMADSVTGGGLHGKDLSKADVSVNIYAWLKAQETGKPVQLACAIGDDTVDGIPYREIVETAGDTSRALAGLRNLRNGAGAMKTTTEMQLVPITKLVPYVNNARTHSPEQITKLRSSLRDVWFYQSRHHRPGF